LNASDSKSDLGKPNGGSNPPLSVDKFRIENVEVRTMRLEQVVPWGRLLSEYRGMFALTDADLDRSILDCGGGPASFNVEMMQLGKSVISCDPVYQFSVAQISQRIDESKPKIIESVNATTEKFVWDEIGTVENLIAIRMSAMTQFLADFEAGLVTGRYQNESLPSLPFADRSFSLALSSHLMFTYSEQLDLDFHCAALDELCRVADEVRIFPIVINMTGERSIHLDPVCEHLTQQGHRVSIETVPYEFQRGGNEMLRIISKG
jgi:hypothetical protein